MTYRARVGLIVLAAGATSRFGGPKQLAPLTRQLMLQTVLAEGHLSPCDPIVLVLGEHAARIASGVELSGVQVVHNNNWREGIASSIRCGVSAVTTDAALTAVIITLGDLPCIKANDYARLINAHRRQPRMLIAALIDDGVGVPVLFPRQKWVELLCLQGDLGTRRLTANHATVSACVPGAKADVDTRDDPLRLSELQSLRPAVTLH